MLTRRHLLQSSLAGAAACGLLPAWMRAAARQGGERERVLVLLELEGGNDGLSTLVPWRDPAYARLRPDLALPAREMLPLDQEQALHPGLRRLCALYEKGELGFVRNVGYSPANLSHFRSRDVWHSGSCSDPLPADGWLGRVGGSSPLTRVALGGERLPRSFRSADGAASAVPALGEYHMDAAPPSAKPDDRRGRERVLQVLHGERGDERLRPIQAAYRAAALGVRELGRVDTTATRTSFPRSSLGRDLEAVAQILAAGLPVRFFHVSQPGYDTHTDQAKDQPELLGLLDQALDAFWSEIQRQGRAQDVLVLAISEFGRRARQNGIGSSAGTDHGTASALFLLGQGLRGGIVGDPYDLEDLDENGNLQSAHDFRSVYASVLEGFLGIPSAPVLGADYPKLPLFSA